MYHHTPHLTHYTKAIQVIAQRGLFAAITLDGLLVKATVMDYEAGCAADLREPSDCLYESMTVFPVNEGGMVASRALREWLGF